jgi:DNA processing protein
LARRDDDHRVACATLTYLAEPADPALGCLLQVLNPVEVLASIRSGTIPARAARPMNQTQAAGLRSALARWRSHLPRVPASAALAQHAAGGIRLICSGETGWPPQLDDLGAARSYALCVRGTADLRASCEKSLAVVGARAATAYGQHAATCIAADLAGRGWAIVSGGA